MPHKVLLTHSPKPMSKYLLKTRSKEAGPVLNDTRVRVFYEYAHAQGIQSYNYENIVTQTSLSQEETVSF
jgi:hypothetical protein